VAVYGSQARGSVGPASDVDVLQLVAANPRSYSVGAVNVTAYTPEALRGMARRGSLFVLHLRTDALVLSDPDLVLRESLDTYRAPASYATLYDELRAVSAALLPATDSTDYAERLRGLGMFALRTAIYARLADLGCPTFDLRAAAAQISDHRVSAAVVIRRLRPGPADLRLLHDALGALLGPLPANPYGSVEALAVMLSGPNPYAAALLAHALSRPSDAGELDYTAIPPPPL
jgi:hypothetical protein